LLIILFTQTKIRLLSELVEEILVQDLILSFCSTNFGSNLFLGEVVVIAL